jgi:hypothetical protein
MKKNRDKNSSLFENEMNAPLITINKIIFGENIFIDAFNGLVFFLF